MAVVVGRSTQHVVFRVRRAGDRWVAWVSAVRRSHTSHVYCVSMGVVVAHRCIFLPINGSATLPLAHCRRTLVDDAGHSKGNGSPMRPDESLAKQRANNMRVWPTTNYATNMRSVCSARAVTFCKLHLHHCAVLSDIDLEILPLDGAISDELVRRRASVSSRQALRTQQRVA